MVNSDTGVSPPEIKAKDDMVRQGSHVLPEVKFKLNPLAAPIEEIDIT